MAIAVFRPVAVRQLTCRKVDSAAREAGHGRLRVARSRRLRIASTYEQSIKWCSLALAMCSLMRRSVPGAMVSGTLLRRGKLY